jgi:hypothetical protein
VQQRVHRWLKRHGFAEQMPVEERSNELSEDDPLTSCLRVASAQGTFATLLDPATGAGAAGHDDGHFDLHSTARKSKCVASHEGFNLHAGTTVAAGHRSFLERLFRYGARPALALDRLERLPDGRFWYRMKYPVHGHTHRTLAPMELMARLSSVIPPPRYPLVRFAGVFAAGSSWRKLVVPAHPAARRCCAEHQRERERHPQSAPVPAASNALPDTHDSLIVKTEVLGARTDGPAPPRASPLDLARGPSANAATRVDWASLLRHGLEVDALACARCGGRMRVLSAVTDPAQVRRVLEHYGERTAQRVPSRAWDPVPVDGSDLPIGDWN